MANRLAGETSPYLLQHQDNPVDWYPWGEEAFARARAENKPILLSVGYSSCHWCHVMAHESFEDPAIADLMNRWFVNIKVDREERPDIDAVYMTATQALTGQGGWPMTVFLTPEGEPFYAGTYFPPHDAYGRPGFATLLRSIHQAWETDRDHVRQAAGRITEHLRRYEAATVVAGDLRLTPALPDQAVARLRQSFDRAWGGFGGAPKFPTPATYEFLLMYHARAELADRESAVRARLDETSALGMVLLTLRRMAAGGMIDHLGGGFARYSVDARWLVPHFEKMLYDNAQLARLYLHAWQLTGDRTLETVARDTLDYLVRDMRHPAGGFFSATDADSEGIEGKYFVWTPGEIVQVLGPEDGALFNAVYAVTPEGNFQDPHHPEFGRRNVLSRPRPLGEHARELGLDEAVLEDRLKGMRARLLQARRQRVPPGLDDKVLTSWNGLALAAFAEAGRVFRDRRYLEVALANAEFVRRDLWVAGPRPRLLHSWKDGVARIEGMLEDYAYYGLGLIELYKATGQLRHLDWARELLQVIIDRFHDPAGGGFFETADDAEALIVRQKATFDGPTPSGNAAAGLVAWWLGRYDGRRDWEALAAQAVGLVADRLLAAPSGFGAAWQLVELLLAPHREIAIVGIPGAREPFEREVARRFLPSVVLAVGEDGGLPVLENRTPAPGTAAAYVCEDMACQLPATSVEDLRSQLDALAGGALFHLPKPAERQMPQPPG